MHCFNHSMQAIGICKHCQRALCKDCCTDLGHGLACKDKHESEVSNINNIMDFSNVMINSGKSNEKLIVKTNQLRLGTSIFSISVGLLFSYFGHTEGKDYFLITAGILFIVHGFAVFLFNFKKLNKSQKIVKEINEI